MNEEQLREQQSKYTKNYKACFGVMSNPVDFSAVRRFVRSSLVLQSNYDTQDVVVGAKHERGPQGERGFLVIAANDTKTPDGSLDGATTLEELRVRCQEDDDSDCEDVRQLRLNCHPESKSAPYFCRLRIGLDRVGREGVSPNGISSSLDDDRPNSTLSNTGGNSRKLAIVCGVDDVVPFFQLPRDEEGNSTFTFMKDNKTSVNSPFREFARTILKECNSVVLDDRDLSGSMWNFVGEMLMEAVLECREKHGYVKIYAMATPAVSLASSNTYTKLYDLSKLPEDEESAALVVEDDGARANLAPPQEPSLQYDPSSDEYGLTGVRAVDLLLPPEFDPEMPPPNETFQEFTERKKEQVLSLLYLWINQHRDACQREGAAHTVFVIQRIPDGENTSKAKMNVVTGLYDETKSHLCKSDRSREKNFNVWTKDAKEGEHYSQRLTSATASLSNLISELVKLAARGRRDLNNSCVRQLVRSHVITRLMKGTLSDPQGQLAWITCVRRGQILHATCDKQPYSNESASLESYILPSSSHFTYVRQFEAMSVLNKYRLRFLSIAKKSPGVRALSNTPSSSREQYPSPRALIVRSNFHANARSNNARRSGVLLNKLQLQENKMRLSLLQQEKHARVLIERAKTQFRLKEYNMRRKIAIEKKKIEIRHQLVEVRQAKQRRLVMRRKRQFTPPGVRRSSVPRWDGDAVNSRRGRAATPDGKRPKPKPAPSTSNKKQGPSINGVHRPSHPFLSPKPKPPQGGAARKAPRSELRRTPSPPPAPANAWSDPVMPDSPGANQAPPPKRPQGKAAQPQAKQSAVQVRQQQSRVAAGDVKKVESEEFMKRTMLEQDYLRLMKKIINEIFLPDHPKEAEQLIGLTKPGAAPAAKPAENMLQKKISAQSMGTRVPSKLMQPSVPQQSAKAPSPARSSSSSSNNSGRSSVKSPRSPSPDLDTIRQQQAKKPPLPPPKQSESMISPVSSRSSSRSSYSSDDGGAMKPVPVKSEFVSKEQEEFYQSPQPPKTRISRDSARPRSIEATRAAAPPPTVETVRGSTTVVTKQVIPTSTFVAIPSSPKQSTILEERPGGAQVGATKGSSGGSGGPRLVSSIHQASGEQFPIDDDFSESAEQPKPPEAIRAPTPPRVATPKYDTDHEGSGEEDIEGPTKTYETDAEGVSEPDDEVVEDDYYNAPEPPKAPVPTSKAVEPTQSAASVAIPPPTTTKKDDLLDDLDTTPEPSPPPSPPAEKVEATEKIMSPDITVEPVVKPEIRRKSFNLDDLDDFGYGDEANADHPKDYHHDQQLGAPGGTGSRRVSMGVREEGNRRVSGVSALMDDDLDLYEDDLDLDL